MGNTCTVSSSSKSGSGETLKNYSFDELKIATRNFRRDAMIGWGRGTMVFKGWIDHADILAPVASSQSGSGMMVTIKKYENVARLQKMLLEWNAHRKISHPNVIKVLGYCFDGEHGLLVYEFMQKGSLDEHLFNGDRSIVVPISWNTRIQIAIGVARGLAFLHSYENPIIQGYLNPLNIMLDGSYNPKVPDFGLESWFGAHSSVVNYADPKWLRTGKLNVKSDVYSFGVVLLAMLTGLRARDYKRPVGKQKLVVWAKPLLCNRRDLRTIMDARMDGQYSRNAAFKAAQLVLKCLSDDFEVRPTMKEVVDALERVTKM